MPRLQNKTCVVTGAARGIGHAIARRFHEEGATVILTDRNADTGIAAAESIGCRFEPLDVSDEADWARLADIVPAADVVVNNAGSPGSRTAMSRTTPNMPRWRTGARCTGSIWTAPSWAVATPSAR